MTSPSYDTAAQSEPAGPPKAEEIAVIGGLHVPYWTFTKRIPGECSSACAYAFLGGVERRIDAQSRIGFHQFYFSENAGAEWRIFETVSSGQEQETASFLLSYVLIMDIDPQVIIFTGLTKPLDMFWMNS